MNDSTQANRALMIAFHFPPIGGSSGFLRTACFARYLRDVSWEPVILTASTLAYPNIELSNANTVRDIETHRALAFDAKRHFSLRGRYFRFTALPDQWASWTIPAIRKGLSLIKSRSPSVVWSTFPIPTALAVGYWVARLSGKPWVVDIRDVIVDDDFPETDIERRSYTKLEKRVVEAASAVVVATESARAMYLSRYPTLRNRLHVIRNGFDEEIFSKVEHNIETKSENSSTVRLLHSGLLSATDRNPIPFFDALVRTRDDNVLADIRLEVLLRACGDEERYRTEIQKRDLENIVIVLPPIAYEEAVKEMMTADGLLLFQGATCNHAVPAKVYEYLRCGVPIFAAVDHEGETAKMLEQLGCRYIADIASSKELSNSLVAYINAIRSGNHSGPARQEVMKYSRRQQAHLLGKLFDDLCAQHRDGPAA